MTFAISFFKINHLTKIIHPRTFKLALKHRIKKKKHYSHSISALENVPSVQGLKAAHKENMKRGSLTMTNICDIRRSEGGHLLHSGLS